MQGSSCWLGVGVWWDTAQAACVFSREWHGVCQERPGVPQDGAAEGFLCRKAGDGWDMGGCRSRFHLDLTVPICM